MKKFLAQIRESGRGLQNALHRHGRDIAYYGGVAAVLAVIAFAGESYRNGRQPEPAASTFPAAEIMRPLEVEADEEPLQAPEGAELLRAYTSLPEWNSALGLWESHEAVDYRTDGDAVASLSCGIVRTVGKSGVYGGFVEVESGEYLLRYASIAPREGLAPGDMLDTGDPIGTADASMSGEAALGAHLHLELYRGDAREDFVSICAAAQR